MEIRNTFGLTAPAEVVFDVMTNPDRSMRWLPFDATAEQVGAGEWRLVAGDGSEQYHVSTSTSDLTVEWRAVDAPETSGSARVRDGASGGSEVDIVVRVPELRVDPARMTAVTAELVRRLQLDVSDNFNAG